MTDPKQTTGVPGGLVPDRTAVPDPNTVRTSVPDAESPAHRHAETVAELNSPEVEAHAPGRTTHGATNNP